MQTRRIQQHLAHHSIVVVATAAMLLASMPVFAGSNAPIAPAGSMVGQFTGEMVEGRPLYRLPSITVRASRKAELAKMAAEERQAAARASEAHRVLALSQARALDTAQSHRIHVAEQ